MKSTSKFLLPSIAAVCLAAATSPFVQAQQRSTSPGSRSGANDPVVQRQMREREFNLRILDRAASTRAAEKAANLAYEQIEDDFIHIQMVNNKMMQAVIRGDTLDFTFVAKSVSEIKKRAERLKENLVLPEPEKEAIHTQGAVKAEPQQLKSSLSKLGELVAVFAENPIFQTEGVVDVKLSAKARRDLEEIIKLSNQVKKSNEQLNKAAQRSRDH
jgi:hypothetical protein